VLELVTTKLAIAGEKKLLKCGHQPHMLNPIAAQQEWSGMEIEVTPLSGSTGTGEGLSFGLKKLEVERLLTEQEKRERDSILAQERSCEQAALQAAAQQERERAQDRQQRAEQRAEKPALVPPPAQAPVAPKLPVKPALIRPSKPECGCSKAGCMGCGPECDKLGCSHFKRKSVLLKVSGTSKCYWKCVGAHVMCLADPSVLTGAPAQGASGVEVRAVEEHAGAARPDAGGREGEQPAPAAARPHPAPPGASAAAVQRPMPAKATPAKRPMDDALRTIVSNVEQRASSGRQSKHYPLSASVEAARSDKCPRVQGTQVFARAHVSPAPAAAGPSAPAKNPSFDASDGWRRKKDAPRKEVVPAKPATSADALPVARARAGPSPAARAKAFETGIPAGRRGSVEVVDICGDSSTEVDSESEDLEGQLAASLGGNGSRNPVLID
jgi:hypothetical protein